MDAIHTTFGGAFQRMLLAPALLDRDIARPGHCSTGTLLAPALLDRPDLLVLDEPAPNVDLSGQADLFELIADVRDRRCCGAGER